MIFELFELDSLKRHIRFDPDLHQLDLNRSGTRHNDLQSAGVERCLLKTAEALHSAQRSFINLTAKQTPENKLSTQSLLVSWIRMHFLELLTALGSFRRENSFRVKGLYRRRTVASGASIWPGKYHWGKRKEYSTSITAINVMKPKPKILDFIKLGCLLWMSAHFWARGWIRMRPFGWRKSQNTVGKCIWEENGKWSLMAAIIMNWLHIVHKNRTKLTGQCCGCDVGADCCISGSLWQVQTEVRLKFFPVRKQRC